MLNKILRLTIVSALVPLLLIKSAAVSAQTPYICGYSTDGVLQSGMTGYPFPYIIVCSTGEKIAWGDLGGWGIAKYVQIYDPVIIDISSVQLNDGTVISKKIQGWRSYSEIPDCNACEKGEFPSPPGSNVPSSDFVVLCGQIIPPRPVDCPSDVGGCGSGEIFIPYGRENNPEEWIIFHPLGIYVRSRNDYFWLGDLVGYNQPVRLTLQESTLSIFNRQLVIEIEDYEVVGSCEPLPTPTPTLPPIVTEDIRRWLDEKAALAFSLETVDIPTALFPVPGVHAYDESAARDLLNRLNVQLEQGTLTLEQFEALKRLTLEEHALAQMLLIYTNVAASLTDTYADSIKTALAVVFAVRPAWNVCQSKIPFCDRLQEATEGTIWRLIRDSGRLAAHTIGSAPDQRETGAKVWDLIVRLTENRLSEGQSLAELLVDDGIQAATTALLIQPYLARTQELIDRGVRTADLDLAATDRWAITGDADRAALLVGELTQKANWEAQDALSRHTDFQAAADLARVAEDTADLATLSPLALMAKAVGLGARLEHLFIVNLPLIYLNSQNLGCVEYLSSQAAEMAFDSAQPSEDCRYRQGMLPPDEGQIILAAYRRAPAMHPLRSQLQDAADDYHQAVQAFTQAVQAGDLDTAEQSLDRLLQADESLEDTVAAMQAILLEHETLGQNDLALIDRSNAFAATSFALYLAAAETLTAQQEGQSPQTDLAQIAQGALSRVDEIERTATLVDLTLPTGRPILLIRAIEAQITPDGQLQVDVRVSNVGAGDAFDVKVLLLIEATQAGSPAALGILKAGAETGTILRIPSPTVSSFTVQVWNQDVLMDYRIEGLPVAVSAEDVVVHADQGWQNTNILIKTGDLVTVKYLSGQWTHWSGTIPLSDASGEFEYVCANVIPASSCVEPIPDFSKGALIGRVGDQLLKIGNQYSFHSESDGFLFLRINDGDDALHDNEGAIRVRVIVQHSSEENTIPVQTPSFATEISPTTPSQPVQQPGICGGAIGLIIFPLLLLLRRRW